MKQSLLHPSHPERICWGCNKHCPATELACGNGSERTPHPVELFGEDWRADRPDLDKSIIQMTDSKKAKELKEYDDNDPYLLGRRTLDDGRVLRLYKIIGGASLKVAQNESDAWFTYYWDFDDITKGMIAYNEYDGINDPKDWQRKSSIDE